MDQDDLEQRFARVIATIQLPEGESMREMVRGWTNAETWAFLSGALELETLDQQLINRLKRACS